MNLSEVNDRLTFLRDISSLSGDGTHSFLFDFSPEVQIARLHDVQVPEVDHTHITRRMSSDLETHLRFHPPERRLFSSFLSPQPRRTAVKVRVRRGERRMENVTVWFDFFWLFQVFHIRHRLAGDVIICKLG
jgi:hypothetical protein